MHKKMYICIKLTKILIVMIGTIIYIIGIVLSIMACVEIFKLQGDFIKKLIFVVLILLTSWIGLAVYYLYARTRIGEWVK